MKKTLLAAALIVGLMATTQAASVSSAETYAIINMPVVAGMNAVGISVLPTDGTAASQLEQIILPEALTKGSSPADADTLYIPNGDSYSIFWLDTDGTWKNEEGTAPTVQAGDSVWIKAQKSATTYQIGIAKPDATAQIAIDPSATAFIANPYPFDLDLNNAEHVDWTKAQGDTNWKDSDLIRVWNGIGYDTYFYYVYGGDKSLRGWYTVKNEKAPAIPAGQGFWYTRRGTSTDMYIEFKASF